MRRRKKRHRDSKCLSLFESEKEKGENRKETERGG
jgi:hypothetical protein